MNYEYLDLYMSQKGGWDFSNYSRNERIKDAIKGHNYLKTGTTICGVMARDAVVLAADTRATQGIIVADKNCSKLHRIADNIYCAGAGVAADLEHTTLWLANNIELHRLNTKKQPRVQMCVSMLVHELYKYQGYKQCALIIGGHDYTGPQLFSVSPHGSSDSLPFCTMGSGSLNAMSVLEEGYSDGLSVEEATELVVKAISAGITNDLGSGGNVDVVVLDKNGSQHSRTFKRVCYRTYAPTEDKLPAGTTAYLREHIEHVKSHVVVDPIELD